MNPVICVGAAIVDNSFHCLDEPQPGTSNPAKHSRSAGGVARNIAHSLAQLGDPVELITHFGSDADGTWLKSQCVSVGIGVTHSRTTLARTGQFAGIITPSGELYTGAAETHLEDEITIPFLSDQLPFLKSARIILLDCNLNIPCIAWLLDLCRAVNLPCIIEPVSAGKASRLRDLDLRGVLLITPNTAELSAIGGDSRPESLLDRGVLSVWMRKGRDGSQLISAEETITLPAPEIRITDTTGAGDAALAGWIHGQLRGKSRRECMVYGHALAQLILQTTGAHSARLTAELLETTVESLKI